MLYRHFLQALPSGSDAAVVGELGITKSGAFVFKPDFILGYIEHKPTVTLNGTIFFTIQLGEVLPPHIHDLAHDKMFNPTGLPLLAGQKNVLLFYLNLKSYGFRPASPEEVKYYDSLAPGADINVQVTDISTHIQS